MAGKLPRLSPSGAKTIRRCMTRWWLEKIGGRRPPTTPAQSIGLAIHERAENYIQTGEWGFPDDDPIVQLVVPGVKYLDDMREGFLHRGGEVEKLYELPRGEFAVPVFCRTDYVEHASGLIVDHKSTKDIYSQYIPTPFDLANPGDHGDQMLWYGFMEWRDSPNPPDSYEVQHTYFSSVAPASRVVRVRTTWEKTMVVAKKFAEIGREMFDAAQILQPEELEYNLDACGDYRGCPHANYCPHFQGQTTALSGLRARLKRREDPKPQPTQEKPAMGFRDRKKKELEAAKAAEADAPEPGEGQGNPPDTPGTETPTETQLEEVCDAVLEELGPEAGNAEITAWLTGDGNEALVRAGLGRPHVARILRYWSGDEGADEELPAEPEAAPEEDEEDGENPVIAYLRDNGGKVKTSDKGLAAAIRDVTGIGRLTTQARTRYLGELNDQGLVNLNSIHVWLLDDAAEAAEAADEEEEEEATTEAPYLKLASDAPNAVATSNGAYRLTFGIGCMPQGGEFVETIDALLEPYYQVAHDAAVDEDGKKVGDLLLWAYGKGPKTVAALVRADVAEGRLPPTQGFVFVPKDHFMAAHIGMMFPDAPVIRGV